MEKKIQTLGLLLVVAMMLMSCAGVDTPVPVETADTRTPQEVVDDEIQLLIEDGMYEDDVTYSYHSGTETVRISLSVEDGIITAVSITESDDVHPTSSRLIRGVDAQLQTLAVGKPIAELDLPDNIAGSSLTVAAFKEYVRDLSA